METPRKPRRRALIILIPSFLPLSFLNEQRFLRIAAAARGSWYFRVEYLPERVHQPLAVLQVQTLIPTA